MDCKPTSPAFVLEGDITYLYYVGNQTNFPSILEVVTVSVSKAAHYSNILEKMLWTKNLILCARNAEMQEIQEELSPSNIFW